MWSFKNSGEGRLIAIRKSEDGSLALQADSFLSHYGIPSHMHIAFNEFPLKQMKQPAKFSVPKKDEDLNGSV